MKLMLLLHHLFPDGKASHPSPPLRPSYVTNVEELVTSVLIAPLRTQMLRPPILLLMMMKKNRLRLSPPLLMMNLKRPGNYLFLLYLFIYYFPSFPYPSLSFLAFFFYASQFEEECWNCYKLLRFCHDYVILAYRTRFILPFAYPFAYELIRTNEI
jgi:pilus assembly protein TadC